MKTNILDCTLRDGGYYNNWQFSPRLIQNYINLISKLGIKYVEIGFLFLPLDKKKGLTAYCNKQFFKNFQFPKDINFGIMINASDLINYTSRNDERKKIKTLKDLKNTNISFIRIASHFEEIYKIEKYLKILKKLQKVELFINIMQISEIKNSDIPKICSYSKNFFKYLYIADSLGSLKKEKIKNLVETFKKYWPSEMGIHAHDNLSLALRNTIYANKLGINWLDCTVTGMGRGPGNTKTEELIKFFINSNLESKKSIKNLLKIFLRLKKKYRWGTNSLYKLSGKYKIHPTYIQTMLSDKRYNRNDYLKAINYLKNNIAKTFNPFKLLTAFNIYRFNKKIIQKNNIKLNEDNYNQALILGPGKNVEKIKDNLSAKIKITKLLVICLNNSKTIKNELIDIRAFCHPMRIFSSLNYFKTCKNTLLVPYSCLSKKTQSFFRNKDFIDYGIQIKKNININKNYISFNIPLALIYSIGFLVSRNIKQIYLAGFDGYSKDEINQDTTFEMLETLKKLNKFKKIKIVSLTNTNLNLKKVSINKIRLS